VHSTEVYNSHRKYAQLTYEKEKMNQRGEEEIYLHTSLSVHMKVVPSGLQRHMLSLNKDRFITSTY
jgi:hypothetical protein